MTFTASVEPRRGGGVSVRLPFDPSTVWGERERYHVTGMLSGRRLRGSLVPSRGAYELRLGPAWCRGCGISGGESASVTLEPEGPQLATVADDLAAALEAEPAARSYFESLATFYCTGFERWVEQAKRPETRAARIRATVEALMERRRQP
jgi:hypothetical protein